MNKYERVASHKAIRIIHVRLSRLESEINKFLPEEDSNVVMKYKIIHREIDTIITKSQASLIQSELEKTWENIYRYNRKYHIDQNMTGDKAERLAIKHSLINYIRDRIKLKPKNSKELVLILERLQKGD